MSEILKIHVLPEDHQHPRFEFGRFFLYIVLQVALYLGIFFLVAPDRFFFELSRGLGRISVVAFWIGLFVTSLFEYFYHRYALHAQTLPFAGGMHEAHTKHHGLTSVKAPVRREEPETAVPVTFKYAIEQPGQEESMMFPPWGLTVFQCIFLLVALPLHALFPQEPIILGVGLAVTLHYVWYEVYHAILHLPFDKYWAPVFDYPVIGPKVKNGYAFHLMHHFRPSCNEAVVGFWGFAIWDYVFRTHKRPPLEFVPIKEGDVRYVDVQLPTPCWLIRYLDGRREPLFQWSRRVEKRLGFVSKKSGV
jgi:hypothetical protein